MPITFLKKSLQNQLKNPFIRNIGWLGGAELINRFIRLGATVVLARSLTEADYGLAAVVLTTNDIANVFIIRSGIGSKIVQAPEEDVADYCQTAYWLNWILGICLFILQCCASFPIAYFYKDNDLIVPICFAAIVYLIMPFFLVHNALIDRANRLQVTAISTAIQSMLINVLTMAFASLKMGLWAIVIPVVITIPVWIVVTHINHPWRPKLKFSLYRWQELVSFGKNVLGSELLDKLRANLDYLLVGYFLGVDALGLYFFAFNAGLGISLNVINVVVWPLYPHLCAVRNNYQQLKSKYFQSLKTISTIVIPLVILQASLAPIYVPLVFGEKWRSAIPIIVLVCLSALPRPFANASSILLQTLDRTINNLRWNIIFTIFFTVCLLVGMHWGNIGVATSVLVSHIVAMPLFTIWVNRQVFHPTSPYRLTTDN